MIAKFEKRKLSGQGNISAHKYENLQNLPHWHIECELVFCDYGSAKVTVGSEQYTLEKGHCLFIASGEVHNIQSVSDSVTSVIKIDQKFVETSFEGLIPTCPLIKTALPLEEIFDRLYAEITGNQPFCTVVCDSIILETLALLFRNCDMTARRTAAEGEKYKALLRHIEKCYAEITFEEAAEFMCYSKPYFSRYFSLITGMTFSSYLNIIRVAEAISMLKEGRLTVSEIAYASGFGTIRHFNRVFKTVTGFSPSELPENYVLIQYRKADSSEGFDPTLSSAAIL